MDVFQIERIELRNIKSHQETAVAFPPGFNVIHGDNGSGKTTLLESVGYALFDKCEYPNQTQMRRAGESLGEIVVTLRTGTGKRYQVVRKIGGAPALAIYDDFGARLSRSAAEATDWLARQFGVEKGKYMELLWSHAIGPAQGTMTAIFMADPAARKAVFGPLLRVDEYEAAFHKLSPTRSRLRALRGEADIAVARLQERLQRLPVVEAQILDVVERLDADGAELIKLNRLREQIELELSIHQERLARLQGLERELERAGDSVTSLETQVAQAARLVAEAEEATRIVVASRLGHEQHLAAQTQRQALERRRAERDRLRESLAETDRDLHAAGARLEAIAGALEEVAAAERRLVALEPLVAEQTRLEGERDRARDRIVQRENALKAVAGATRRLKGLRAQLDDVREQLEIRATLEGDLEALDRRRIDLESRINTSDEAIRQVEEAREPLQRTWREAQQAAGERDRLQAQLDRDEADLANYGRDLERVEAQAAEHTRRLAEHERLAAEYTAAHNRHLAAQAEADRFERELSALARRLALLPAGEAAECPVCKSPLDAHRAGELEAEFQRERERLERERREALALAEAEGRRADALRAQAQAERHAALALPTQERAAEMRAAHATKQQELDTVRGRIAELAPEAGALETRRLALQRAEADLATLRGERADLANDLSQANNDIRRLQTRIGTLPQPQRAAEIEVDIGDVEAELEREQATADELVSAQADSDAALQALEALGDPSGAAREQQGIARRGPGLLADQARYERRRDELQAKRRTQIEALLAFAGLDEELVAVDQALQATRGDHQRFTANERTSGLLAQREAEYRRLSDNLESARARVAGLERDLAGARAAYDPEAHAHAITQTETLRTRIGQLETQIRMNKDQLGTLEREQADLHRTQGELRARERAVAHLERRRQAVEFTGDKLRDAGRTIVKRLIESISFRANKMFQAITADPAMSLAWDETFAVSVTRGAEQLAFKQLSGGEQMVAALAVRLALLMELSTVRMLFLDEPTAHVDQTRRGQLAERVANLGSQLDLIVAITHDDAFASVAGSGRRIELRKDPLANRTEVG